MSVFARICGKPLHGMEVTHVVGVGMRRAILTALLFLCLTITPSADAQLAPAVEIDCESSIISVDVKPGSGLTELICTFRNPNSYVEEINIDTDISSPISLGGPSKVTLPAGDEVDITFVFSAATATAAGQTTNFTISGLVESANGVPVSSFGFSDEFEGQASIAAYAMLAFDMSSMTRYVDAGGNDTIQVDLANDGNSEGTAKVAFVNGDELMAQGFILEADQKTIALDSGESGTLYFNITAPKPEVDLEITITMSAQLTTGGEVQTDYFKLVVAKVPEAGIGALGDAVGIDDATMTMILFGGGGGLFLLLMLMISLKVSKKRKARSAEMEDWDEEEDWELDEIADDDDDFDFEDL